MRSVEDLRTRLTEAGAAPLHVRRLVRFWLDGRGFDEVSRRRGRTPRRGRRLEQALPSIADALDDLVREVHREEGEDGARRVLRLASGRTVESVDLPRGGVCVSTQVGCAVGCRFCKTGEDGLLQQLTALEILAQIAHARRDHKVRRVVFMGMGEPAHNLDAVLEAIDVLGHEGDIGHKNLVFSTVGDPADFTRLGEGRVRPALALSLHTVDDAKRADLLPRAPKVPVADLLEAALAYAERIGYPLLVQWTLLEDFNDADDEADRLAAFLGGRRAIVNFIPFNDVEGNGFARPPIGRCVGLVRRMRRHGVITTLRLSAAQDVDGGCGQLRARLNP